MRLEMHKLVQYIYVPTTHSCIWLVWASGSTQQLALCRSCIDPTGIRLSSWKVPHLNRTWETHNKTHYWLCLFKFVRTDYVSSIKTANDRRDGYINDRRTVSRLNWQLVTTTLSIWKLSVYMFTFMRSHNNLNYWKYFKQVIQSL